MRRRSARRSRRGTDRPNYNGAGYCDVTIDATNRIVDNVAEQLTTRFRASGLIDPQSGSNLFERPTT